MRYIYSIITALTLSLVITSCSETELTDNEYDNWQQRNDEYFSKIYATASSAIASKSEEWKIIRSYAKPNSQTGNKDENIVVQVLENGKGTECPLFTDSVKVHYRGTLMPSASYPAGFQFDSSWTGDYDIQTMSPYKGICSVFVDGFSTALQNMHEGDHWRVFIPQKLGYGSTASEKIPAYSTLVFDLTLVKAWHPKSE